MYPSNNKWDVSATVMSGRGGVEGRTEGSRTEGRIRRYFGVYF